MVLSIKIIVFQHVINVFQLRYLMNTELQLSRSIYLFFNAKAV
jgi:hypothetical protein